MTTKTHSQDQATVNTAFLPIIVAVLAGAFLIVFAGFAEATVFHDSAHDTRHAFSFPCH
jgi:cobalt transporter subunit CbtB